MLLKTLGVSNLTFNTTKQPFLQRLWRLITFRGPKTIFEVNGIEFMCRVDIPKNRQFELKGIIFAVTDCNLDLFDNHWHIKAVAVNNNVVTKKPKRLDFSYTPIYKLYGGKPVH